MWTTGPPPSTNLIGLACRRVLGLPWVADIRDGWRFERNHTDFPLAAQRRLDALARPLADAQRRPGHRRHRADRPRRARAPRRPDATTISNGFDLEELDQLPPGAPDGLIDPRAPHAALHRAPGLRDALARPAARRAARAARQRPRRGGGDRGPLRGAAARRRACPDRGARPERDDARARSAGSHDDDAAPAGDRHAAADHDGQPLRDGPEAVRVPRRRQADPRHRRPHGGRQNRHESRRGEGGADGGPRGDRGAPGRASPTAAPACRPPARPSAFTTRRSPKSSRPSSKRRCRAPPPSGRPARRRARVHGATGAPASVRRAASRSPAPARRSASG